MLYAAYGSNLSLAQMAHRCPGARPLMAGSLPNYRLAFRSPSGGNGVANIEPCEQVSVPVALYEITPADLRALDHYEGFPGLYRREAVAVEAADGRAIDAVVYILNTPTVEAPPSRAYLAGIAEGYRDWGLSADSLAALADDLGIWREAADGR